MPFVPLDVTSRRQSDRARACAECPGIAAPNSPLTQKTRDAMPVVAVSPLFLSWCRVKAPLQPFPNALSETNQVVEVLHDHGRHIVEERIS